MSRITEQDKYNHWTSYRKKSIWCLKAMSILNSNIYIWCLEAMNKLNTNMYIWCLEPPRKLNTEMYIWFLRAMNK